MGNDIPIQSKNFKNATGNFGKSVIIFCAL